MPCPKWSENANLLCFHDLHFSLLIIKLGVKMEKCLVVVWIRSFPSSFHSETKIHKYTSLCTGFWQFACHHVFLIVMCRHFKNYLGRWTLKISQQEFTHFTSTVEPGRTLQQGPGAVSNSLQGLIGVVQDCSEAAYSCKWSLVDLCAVSFSNTSCSPLPVFYSSSWQCTFQSISNCRLLYDISSICYSQNDPSASSAILWCILNSSSIFASALFFSSLHRPTGMCH